MAVVPVADALFPADALGGIDMRVDVTASILFVPDLDAIVAPPDSTPPSIGNFNPAPGSTINPGDALEVDVTDNLGQLLITHVWVVFADGSAELVWDGDDFTAFYEALSTRTAITDGYRYSVRHLNGWSQGVTLKVDAVDQAGNRHTP